MLIHEVIKESAFKYKDKIFASSNADNLTYRELEVYTDRLTRELQKSGQGIVMGILSKNSIQYLISYFAIIKSGNIAVALNPINTEKELERLINFAEVKILFTNNQFLKIIGNFDDGRLKSIMFINFDDNEPDSFTGKSVSVISFNKIIHNSNNDLDSANVSVTENSIAQIIFTSGTKGTPNGVCLTHRNLIANMIQITNRINITKNDNMLVVLPFYYSYGNSLLLSHLYSGARLTINNNSQLPMFILKDLIDKKCSSIAGVASNFIMLLKRSKFRELDLSNLRYVTFAGEPVADWIISEFIDMKIDVYVMYGQTEATARISILKPDEILMKQGSVGRVVKDIEVRIIDNDGNIMPVNEFGEVIVAGPNIMQGYWKDPETTEEKIRNDYLYTGDCGKIDEDGYLYISGRLDEMIKIGGERVFPIEIEKIILQHEKVADVGVFGIFEKSDSESFSDYMGKIICAFVVPKDGLTTNELLDFCKKNLSRHKVPGKIVFVNELPKTNTGKLKRNYLEKLLNEDSN